MVGSPTISVKKQVVGIFDCYEQLFGMRSALVGMILSDEAPVFLFNVGARVILIIAKANGIVRVLCKKIKHAFQLIVDDGQLFLRFGSIWGQQLASAGEFRKGLMRFLSSTIVSFKEISCLLA